MSGVSDPGMTSHFEQPALPIANAEAFEAVRTAVAASFSSEKVLIFLKSLDRAKVRIRDLGTVLQTSLLGVSTHATYERLSDGDKGQIREFYLASLEQVTPDLRQKFFKLYAYY